MANEPQSLKEFTDNLLSDVASGNISVYEAIAAASQYSYLRELIEEQKTPLGQAEIMGEDELVRVFTAIISQGSGKLQELPNFQSQLPDQALQESEVKSMGEVRKHASTRVKQSTQAAITSQKERRRAFVHDLVTRFSSTMPTLSEDRVGVITDSALVAAAGEATQQQTKERFAELILASSEIAGSSLTADQKNQLNTTIQDVLEDNNDYVSGVTQQTKRAATLTTALYDDIGIKRPDVFVDVVLSAPSSETIPETLTRANKLAHIAASLEAKPEPLGGNLHFFSTANAKGAAKGLQRGADGILSLVGEPLREMVIHEKINGTLRSMLTSAQSFTDRLGENFVHTALFTNISQSLTHQLSDRTQSGQARSMVSDVFSSVFRGPLAPALAQGTKERVLDYFELARASATSPKGRRFLPSHIAPWDVFRTFGPAVSPSTRRDRRTALFFPWLGLSSLSNAVGVALGSLVDRSTSFFLTNSFIPRQLSGSRRAAIIPTPIGQDMPLLVAIIVIVTLVLLFIFPSPLNVSILSHSAKASAIFASLENFTRTVNEVAADVTTFSCVWSGSSPVAPITACPVHAPISQGPLTSTGSHKTLNAWDFAAAQGTPVVAAHDAYIASYANSYAPYQYKAASYGNNVVLVATDPATNQQYCTNYAHLLDVSPVVVANSGSPTLIPAGTVIGYVDTTGYTYGCIAGKCGEGYGTHLHWGYKGPNQNVPIPLPPGCQ